MIATVRKFYIIIREVHMANTSGSQQLAMHYYEMGRYETAENLFAELIAAEPQNPRFLYFFARCLMLQNKESEKVEEIYKSLLIDTQYGFGSNIELAEFYIAKITQDYRKEVTEITRSSIFPRFELTSLKRKTRYLLSEKVLPLIDQAANLKPNSCIVLATYSRYYTASRHFRKAKSFLKKAKEIDHQNSRVILSEINLISRQGGNYNQTLTISNILDSNMTEFKKLIDITLAYDSAKKYKKAFKYAKQVYLMSPTDQTAIYLLKRLEYLCQPINLVLLFIYNKKIYWTILAVLMVTTILFLLTHFSLLMVLEIVCMIYLIGGRACLVNINQKLNRIREEKS